jgi:hypothetical protein
VLGSALSVKSHISLLTNLSQIRLFYGLVADGFVSARGNTNREFFSRAVTAQGFMDKPRRRLCSTFLGQ